MQLLAKFKKILYMEFRATLNFRKFKFNEPVLKPGTPEEQHIANH